MHIVDQGLIYDARGRQPSTSVASFVSLCRTKSGTLLCGFQLGVGKHDVKSTIRLCRSTDHGGTWSELPAVFDGSFDGVPGSLSSGEIVETEPGRLLLYTTWFDRSDPERPLFDPETQGILHSRQLLAESSDDGVTWSDWRELPIPTLKGCSSTGPILKWPDGCIAVAFESYKEFDDPSPGRHGAWLMTSHDGGESFDHPIAVAQDPNNQIYYWDQRLCPGPNPGDAIAMFWTHDLQSERDLPVHLKHVSVSTPEVSGSLLSTGIPGQIAAPLQLDDGRLLAFVVDRSGPMTMRLWQSTDNGLTWPAAEALVVYEHTERANLTQGTSNVDYTEYWSDMLRWSFGHPAICHLPDNQVLVAFYAGTPDCLSVHWARIDATP